MSAHLKATAAAFAATDATAREAADLAGLSRELGTLFSRLCSLASAGATVLAEALNTTEPDVRGDLIAGGEALFGMLGYLGELGVRACGDAGVKAAPTDWLALGDGAQALQRLQLLSQRGAA